MTFLLIFSILLIPVSTFQLDNEVVGSPKIECNHGSITFGFNSRQPFMGNVYVRGFYDIPSCRNKYTEMSSQGGMLNVRWDSCGMTREREFSPRGFSYRITFVANFHRLFSTKEDRAYDVRCFYAHTDSIVKADMDVRGVPTEPLEQATSIVPKCEYTLREGSLDGPRARRTTIGVPIFHRWDCETTGNYGILIKSCSIVNSHISRSEPFLDDKGCAVNDEFPQVVYTPKLNSAYTVIETVSYPDQPLISFACQIILCDKTTDDCLGVSPPLCNNNYQRKIVTEQVLVGNRITEISDQIEPWMKEQTPEIEDETNQTLTNIIQTTTTQSTKYPKLVDNNLIIIANDEQKNREKRLADNVMDVYSDELFIGETGQPELLSNRKLRDTREQNNISTTISKLENKTEEPICIPVETIYTLTLVMIMIIALSFGTVIYLGGHFVKKRKEIESMVKPHYMSKI